MDDNDEDIRFRDKLAVAILPAIIDRFTAYFKNNGGKSGNGWIDGDGESDRLSEQFKIDAKIIAQMSYRIADEMRKARLKSFT